MNNYNNTGDSKDEAIFYATISEEHRRVRPMQMRLFCREPFCDPRLKAGLLQRYGDDLILMTYTVAIRNSSA